MSLVLIKNWIIWETETKTTNEPDKVKQNQTKIKKYLEGTCIFQDHVERHGKFLSKYIFEKSL